MINTQFNLFLKHNTWHFSLPSDNSSIISTHINGKHNKALALKYVENYATINVSHSNINDDIEFSTYVKQYIESKRSLLSPHVYYNYTSFCYPRVLDYFGSKHILLKNVTQETLNDFYSSLNQKGYKHSTISQIAKIIRPALSDAFDKHVISVNPHNFVKPISKDWIHFNFYNKNQLKKLLTFLSGNRFELAIKILIFYGLRRSELLGLRWSAIDFYHNYISVNHKVIFVNGNFITSDILKTPKSYRTLPLIKEIKDDLISHKTHQDFLKSKPNYDHTYDDYVFTDDNGNLIKPARLDYTLSSTIKKANLPHIRLHDLRHSCASLLLSQGVQLKEIQEWLGHASYSTTANIYSHLDLVGKVSTAKSIRHALITNTTKEKSLLNKINQCYDEIKKLGYDSLDEFYMANQK